MNFVKAYFAIMALVFCMSAGAFNPLTSVQLQEEIKTTADTLSLELEARRESLQLIKENLTNSGNESYPTSCLIGNSHNYSSLIVQVPGHKPFQVACDSEMAGLGWLVIQRRRDGLVNFYRDWNEYKEGFGNLAGDFFIGLEKLNWLTSYQPFELYIHLEEYYNKVTVFAKYDEFLIGEESENFVLKALGQYSGTAGDSLRTNKGQAFSTFDRKNDEAENKNCAQIHLGGWWYKDCGKSNLNAQYLDYYQYLPNDTARYITWNSFSTIAPMKIVQMMIRPKFGCF